MKNRGEIDGRKVSDNSQKIGGEQNCGTRDQMRMGITT